MEKPSLLTITICFNVLFLLILLSCSFFDTIDISYWKFGPNAKLVIFSVNVDNFFKYFLVVVVIIQSVFNINFIIYCVNSNLRDHIRNKNEKLFTISKVIVLDVIKWIFIKILFNLCIIQFDMLVFIIVIQLVFLVFFYFTGSIKTNDGKTYGEIDQIFEDDSIFKEPEDELDDLFKK
jgi:hypothetical protein